MTDLSTIADIDLKALISVADVMAKEGNCFFQDLFVILSREALARHTPLRLDAYHVLDLGNAMERLKKVVDESRKAGLEDDYPALLFTRVTLAALIAEYERRDVDATVH